MLYIQEDIISITSPKVHSGTNSGKEEVEGNGEKGGKATTINDQLINMKGRCDSFWAPQDLESAYICKQRGRDRFFRLPKRVNQGAKKKGNGSDFGPIVASFALLLRCRKCRDLRAKKVEFTARGGSNFSCLHCW